MLKFIVPAAIASVVAVSSVSAMAAGSSAPGLKPLIASDVIKTEGGDRHLRPKPDRRNYHYVPGRRYSSAPPHWRRYHSRPRLWRTWGCILVGPVWFCP